MIFGDISNKKVHLKLTSSEYIIFIIFFIQINQLCKIWNFSNFHL